MTAVAHHDRRSRARERLVVWAGAAALMLLPLVALRGLDEAAWDPPGDFVFLFILLAGIGVGWELAARVTQRRAYTAASALAVATALLQAWINLAVGIIGSEDNPANWIYAAVIAAAAAGALLARFRPLAMGRAMIAAAIAQALAFAVALTAGVGFTGPITVFFVALWLISASLFRKAARCPASPGLVR